MNITTAEAQSEATAPPAQGEPVGSALNQAPVAPAVWVEGLCKRYTLETVKPSKSRRGLGRWLASRSVTTKTGELWALRDVSFSVQPGERLGIIGANGAGKSTLLKILARIIHPSEGRAELRGRVVALLEVGTGFSDQMTGRENIFANAGLHGLSRKDTEDRLDDIIAFSGVDPRFIDMRVKHYSSGMRVRLAYSVIAHLEPDVMLLDEVLAAGDMAFQKRCLGRIEGMISRGRSIVFVSHSMSAVAQYCDRVIWLDHGRVMMQGEAGEVIDAYTAASRGSQQQSAWQRAEPAAATDPPSSPETDSDHAPDEPDGSTPPDQTSELRAMNGEVKEVSQGHLESVRLLDSEGQGIERLRVDESFQIELRYRVLDHEVHILPAVVIFNEDGQRLITAVYTHEGDMHELKTQGVYLSRVRVPAHLMMPGRYEVTASLTTPGTGKLRRHEVVEQALEFSVLEAPAEIHTARGLYREVKGAIRPMLDWSTQAEPSDGRPPANG